MEERKRIIELWKQAREQHGDDKHLVMIPKLMAKKTVGYSLMKFDFELINEFAVILSKNIDNYSGSAATYAMISLYGKCFTGSDDGYPKLEAKELFKNNRDFLEDHNYIMDLRHKFISHRSNHLDELGIAYLSIDKISQKTELRYSLRKMSVIHPKRMVSIQELFKYVYNVILEKLKKSGDKTYKGLLKKYSQEELLRFKFDEIKK